MAYRFEVIARDRSQKELGRRVVDLPLSVQEAIEIGLVPNEQELVRQFNAALVVKIQQDLRSKARAGGEVESAKKTSQARAFYAALHGSE